MKSGTRLVALGVFFVTQVLVSLPGHAQSTDVNNTLGLSVENSVTTLSAGETIMVDGWVTPGSDVKGTVHITALEASLLFNPAVFDISSVSFNNTNAFTPIPNNNTGNPFTSGPVSIPSVDSNMYGGIGFSGYRVKGASVLPAQTIFGTYTLTVRSDAPTGDTQLFYSTIKFTDPQLQGAGLSLFQTGIATSSADNIGLTLASPTILTIHVNGIAAVPGPSALLVFAMGAVPAMGMVRSRRRMRHLSRL
jgi:hypothetical protein